MIAEFYKENAAMVCGTYKVTDVDLNEIAPGVIDHHEWTAENGRNNALHVNGFGGPRAFYTPVSCPSPELSTHMGNYMLMHYWCTLLAPFFFVSFCGNKDL